MEKIGRKKLPHQVPLSVDAGEFSFFITICVKERSGGPLLAIAPNLLACARDYHLQGKWYPNVFLVMPDHVHAVIHFSNEEAMTKIVRDWKRWTSRNYGVEWQNGFFDHRLRNAESHSEKAAYILHNPVRAGLVAEPEQWPHVYFAGIVE